MLPCAHEPAARDDARLDLRKMHLHHHTLLASVAVAHLRDPVPGPTNFEENLALDVRLGRSDHELCLLEITRGTACEVRLVLLALGMREVRALVCVKGEAETTF